MNRRTLLKLAALVPGLLLGSVPPRLICFGDSITAGEGASVPARSYASIVAAQAGFVLDNRAISGTLLAEQIAQAILPARVTSPDVALLLTGYNDMRAGTDLVIYQAQLRQAVAHLTEHGATLYLGDCLRMTPEGYAAYGPLWNHGSDSVVASFNDVIHTVASVDDTHAVAAPGAYDPAHVSADLVHPDDRGHREIAASFLAAMRYGVYLPLVRYG